MPVRLIIFWLAFVALTFLETRRTDKTAFDDRRWWSNIALYATNLLLISGFAALALLPEQGRLFAAPELPWLARLVVGFLLLDLLVYVTHRVYHATPFWRLHAVHHSDPILDTTTAIRHHPGEYITTAVAIAGLAWALGIEPEIVGIYGTCAGLIQLVQHAHLSLPAWIEKPLSVVVMTPFLHRLHHNMDPAFFNKNFGTVLTLWDRLFGTYASSAAPAGRYGLSGIASESVASYWNLLRLPLTWRDATATRAESR
jgi:sterol desaturase/sphingolipid hydroxylase (fatty acid hydroxylase superfamily)